MDGFWGRLIPAIIIGLILSFVPFILAAWAHYIIKTAPYDMYALVLWVLVCLIYFATVGYAIIDLTE